MKVLTKLDKGIQVLYDYIMMATGCAVAGLIIVSAFLRYILKIDFYGSEEYILLAGFWLYFTGSMSAARDKSHLSADMVNVFTSNQKVIRLMAIVRDVLSLVICFLAISWCWDYFSWQMSLHPVTSVHRIPKTLQQFPMCFSFVVWAFYLIRDCVKAILAFKEISTEGGVEK